MSRPHIMVAAGLLVERRCQQYYGGSLLASRLPNVASPTSSAQLGRRSLRASSADLPMACARSLLAASEIQEDATGERWWIEVAGREREGR